MIFVDMGAWVAHFSRRDQYHKRAAEIWAKLKTSSERVIKFADQSNGFVDCLSFALMRRHKIITAFSFDRHFDLAGFSLLK